MGLRPFTALLICCYGQSLRFGGIPQVIIDAKIINERDLIFYYEHTDAGQKEWPEHQEVSFSREALKRKQSEKRKECRKAIAEELE